MEPLTTLAIFLAGIIVRALAFVAILALLALPILLVLGGVESLATLRRWARGVTRVGTLTWRPGVYYAPGHTWVEPATVWGAKVGIDDLAQRILPSPLRIALPAVGTRVRRGQPVTTFKADGQETQVLSPITGTVTAVNGRVGRDPTLVHRDPYVRGWLFQVSPSEPDYLRLPRGDDARRWFSDERVRLERMLEHELGYAMADGGELTLPAHTLLKSGQWQRVTDAFFNVT